MVTSKRGWAPPAFDFAAGDEAMDKGCLFILLKFSADTAGCQCQKFHGPPALRKFGLA
jgi:hypothetical protein